MSRYSFGPFNGMRQLITESVRGCSWAYTTNTVCSFCSLESVDKQPRFRPFKSFFSIERHLHEEYGANWIFDVSNQWVPYMRPSAAVEWLRAFVEAKAHFGAVPIQRYVYLTVNSISERTAPLLRAAGVRIAYLGIDGWDTSTRRAYHKTHASASRAIARCRENGIYVRTAVVLGEGLSRESLARLPQFVAELVGEHGDTILSFGTFLEFILQGSPVWYRFRAQATAARDLEVLAIYEFFEREGYLSLQQQEELIKLYIRRCAPPGVDYAMVIETRDRCQAIIKAAGIVGIRIRDGGSLALMAE